MPFSLIVLLFLPSATHNRRSLHQPFFPSPAAAPPPAPPFFPPYSDPPPPPPATSSIPTFRANLSSLPIPDSPSSSHHHFPKLLPILLLPLLALSIAFLLLLLRRRWRRRQRTSDTHHPKPPSLHQVLDSLYLGTIVSTWRYTNDDPGAAASSSPELRPLPPLPKQNHINAGGQLSSSDEEVYYSPRASSSEKDSGAPLSGVPAMTVSTPSYPSFDRMSSPNPSSPPSNRWTSGQSKVELPRTEFDIAGEIGSRAIPPPPLPPPPPPLSSKNEQLVTAIGDCLHNPFVPAPPPPRLPAAGFWQNRAPRMKASSNPVESNSNATVLAAEQPESSGSGERNEDTHRPKLKPLHWDKVRTSSNREMVWDQLKSSSFQVNEEMIETLFVCNKVNATPKETPGRRLLPSSNQEDSVLDPKKSQNIAILLRALNVSKEEVCEALLEGNTESLGTELLETLLKMAPSKEEELKLKQYKDDTPNKLGQAEKFIKAVLDVPFAYKRMDAMLYIANFNAEVNYLKTSFETVVAACEELRSSRLFLKILDAVLKTGNRMNVGTNRGDAHAFKLDTLLKLVDVKGTDGKTTLLHFVVQEIIRSEGSRRSAANSSPSKTQTQTNILRDDLECKKLGLQVVAVLGGELSNVKKAATMDSDVLSSYVSKFAGGIGKVSEVLRLNNTHCGNETGKHFQETLSQFLNKAEDEIIRVQTQESAALSLVKEITEYFHGNSTKEEAHPFRIFMVVRDFLSVLDKVCKEVGRINERSYGSSARHFPVPVNPTLPPLFPRLRALRPDSSDDESSSSQ